MADLAKPIFKLEGDLHDSPMSQGYTTLDRVRASYRNVEATERH